MQTLYIFLYYLHYCLCIKVPFYILDLSIPKMCSIWFSSGEYGGIVNTTHPNFFINYFTYIVLWMLALSNITTILLSYLIFASLDLSCISKSLINSQNWCSLIVLLFIIKYASLFHWAAITLSLCELGLITLSASHLLFIQE